MSPPPCDCTDDPPTRNLDRHPRLQRGGDPARRGRRPARAARPVRLDATRSSSPRTARSDRTVAIAEELARKYPEVRFFSHRRAELRQGAASRASCESRGEFVICDEIDLCDADFHRARASTSSRRGEVDMVIGSKLIAGARGRPPVVAPRGEPGLHRPAAGHARLPRHRHARAQGVSARARSSTSSRDCLVDKDVFASEFVIRAYRAGVRITRSRCACSRSGRRRSTSQARAERAEEPGQAELGHPPRATEPAAVRAQLAEHAVRPAPRP